MRTWLTILTLAGAVSTAAASEPFIVLDAGTGSVLAQSSPDSPWRPASLTKMMTLYATLVAVAKGEVSFSDTVEMTSEAISQAPSSSGLAKGRRLRLDDALRVMMVKSANDVAVAVAQRVGGTVPDFVGRMNAEAAALGMFSSHFVNPNGLDVDGQTTTARDLAILADALISSPAAMAIVSLDGIDLDGRWFSNGNGAMGRVQGTDGMKTGYTCSSGFNVVTTTVRGGRRTIAVLLGRSSAAGRDAEAAALVEASFSSKAEVLGAMRDRRSASNAVPPDLSERLCSRDGRRLPGILDPEGIDARGFAASERTRTRTATIASIAEPRLLAVPAKAKPSPVSSVSADRGFR